VPKITVTASFNKGVPPIIVIDPPDPVFIAFETVIVLAIVKVFVVVIAPVPRKSAGIVTGTPKLVGPLNVIELLFKIKVVPEAIVTEPLKIGVVLAKIVSVLELAVVNDVSIVIELLIVKVPPVIEIEFVPAPFAIFPSAV
jgi:hypothetical protein